MAEVKRRDAGRHIGAAWRQAAALPIWSDPVDPRASFSGGITNVNFVVEDGGRKFVVRIGGDIEVHGVVARNEVAASRAAHAAGVAPRVVYAEPGVLVLDFIEGTTFTPEDVRDPRNLDRIVDLVQTNAPGDPEASARAGRALLGRSTSSATTPTRWPKSASADMRPGDAVRWRRRSELERAVGPVELVFGHNDLLAANFIDDGKRLWLVDWEYAGFNSPLFDLGGLASNSELSPAQRESAARALFRASR